MFYLAVGNDNLRVRQPNVRVLITQIAGVQEDRTVLFSHSHRELIHDTAVAAIEIVFGILTDQRQIRSWTVSQIRRDPSKSRRSETSSDAEEDRPEPLGIFPPDRHVESAVQCHPSTGKGPHNTQRIVGPSVPLLVTQILQRHLHNTRVIQIRGVKAYLIILSLSGNAIGSQRQRAGKHMAAL